MRFLPLHHHLLFLVFIFNWELFSWTHGLESSFSGTRFGGGSPSSALSGSASSSSSSYSPSSSPASLATSADPIKRMVNPGELIHIPCTVMSAGGSVQWIKNGKPIVLDFSSNQRRHWNMSSDGLPYLTITRVTEADEGIWECWELDSFGGIKQKAHIMDLEVANVPETPFLELDGERLSSSSSLMTPTITVRENKVITLRCIVTGASPTPASIQWFIADMNVTDSSQLLMDYSVQNDSYDTQSLLTIQVTKDFHARNLDCVATHVAWTKPVLSTAIFNVLYEPSFSISREPGFGYPIVEGMSVSLKCEIDADPWSQAKWIKDEIPTSHTLLSNPTTSSDAQKTHSATSDSTESEEMKRHLMNRKENERINNNLRGGNKTIPVPMPTSPEGVFSIATAKVSDTGWYRCTTDHEFGTFSSYSYYLHVRFSQAQELSGFKRSAPSHSCSSGSSSFRAKVSAKMSGFVMLVLLVVLQQFSCS